ncbi:hypothetical protein M9H77_22679 [Catharanthus roseus]|uniref:Uncharacterized protein n=1 Tax=Catharanthus roseus TaxID=4058 RepID=A0ACC0ARJ9_CATRO|nr:hypothetical protein M9H77_22679 [Catharanthus roseus]
MEGLAQSVFTSNIASCSAVRWPFVESQEGVETKVSLKVDLVDALRSVAWFYVNGECGGCRVLVRCLASIDYEMLELVSDDLIMESELCPWSPTVALHLTQDDQRRNKPLNLVPRGTQIPYSATVNLVVGLGVSKLQYKESGPNTAKVSSTRASNLTRMVKVKVLILSLMLSLRKDGLDEKVKT